MRVCERETELRPPENKTTNWTLSASRTLSQLDWQLLRSNRINVPITDSPIGSRLQFLPPWTANQRAYMETDFWTAALADSVAPRSGGIWKKFHIRVALCKLSRIDEKCIALSKSLFLSLFSTGSVLMLMGLADHFSVMCPSGPQETGCNCVPLVLLCIISSNTSPIDSIIGQLLLIAILTM